MHSYDRAYLIRSPLKFGVVDSTLTCERYRRPFRGLLNYNIEEAASAYGQGAVSRIAMISFLWQWWAHLDEIYLGL